MKFWRSGSKNRIGSVEEKKNQQSSSSSRMKAFFQFFAKRSLFSPKKKFLPPIQSLQKPPVPKPIQTVILLEDKIDEVCTTSTVSSETVTKSPGVVAKLMGLDLLAPPQRITEPALDSPKKQSSGFPLPKLANNSSQAAQDKLSQTLSPKLTDVSKLVQPEPSAATTGSIQNNASVVIKPSHQNQKKLEQFNIDLYPTRPVKSPPRSLSPVNNAKLLEETARLLDIGSQAIRSGVTKLGRSELQDPVIEKFGSNLGDALKELDGSKSSICTTGNKAKNNEQVNVGGKETDMKRDVSSTKKVSTTETKKDTQKGSSRRIAQENSSIKMPPKQNNIKRNRMPSNAPKDFIALNKSMIKTTSLRKKYNGLDRKQGKENSIKRVRPTDNNNKNVDAKIGKIERVSEKRGGSKLLISKGVGLDSEKLPDSRSSVGEGEEMCIVSFTFSSPMRHSNRDASISDLEGRTDSGLTESSVSSSVFLDDRRDAFSYSGTRISPTTVHQGPSLYDEFASRKSDELSDVDKKGSTLDETKDNNLLIETNSALTSTNCKTSEKRNKKASHQFGPTRNRQFKTSNVSSKIELMLQSVAFSNPNSEEQVSSFICETTEAILKALYKIPSNSKEIDRLREVIPDFLTEYLYLIQSQVLNCGYNSWRNHKIFYTKERIVKEIEQEIVEIESLVGKELEVLIVKDMENWVYSRVNFEIGIQIEREILSQLIGEVARDLLA